LPPMTFVALAVAVLIGIAAAQHVLSNARATADTPVVTVTPAPLIASTIAPISVPKPAHVATTAARPRAAQTAAPAPALAASPPPAIVARAALPPATPARIPVSHAPVARAPVPHATTAARPRTLVAGAGVKTVVATPAKATPAPEPTEVDVSDMPRSYTDATPLPKEQAPYAAQVAAPSVAVPTPTPGPNRSWTHRLVHLGVHLVNTTLTTIGVAKRPAQPTPSPSASPSGPQPR
jgi:hypothetical protein